jgi:hypothetical protein
MLRRDQDGSLFLFTYTEDPEESPLLANYPSQFCRRQNCQTCSSQFHLNFPLDLPYKNLNRVAFSQRGKDNEPSTSFSLDLIFSHFGVRGPFKLEENFRDNEYKVWLKDPPTSMAVILNIYLSGLPSVESTGHIFAMPVILETTGTPVIRTRFIRLSCSIVSFPLTESRFVNLPNRLILFRHLGSHYSEFNEAKLYVGWLELADRGQWKITNWSLQPEHSPSNRVPTFRKAKLKGSKFSCAAGGDSEKVVFFPDEALNLWLLARRRDGSGHGVLFRVEFHNDLAGSRLLVSAQSYDQEHLTEDHKALYPLVNSEFSLDWELNLGDRSCVAVRFRRSPGPSRDSLRLERFPIISPKSDWCYMANELAELDEEITWFRYKISIEEISSLLTDGLDALRPEDGPFNGP